ncbi:MAG: formylglycine-generating enzyme family protein [Nitrospirae bacterium]|nr:formylglycine-generating enzyme family protein [Nitrospirota bacterium]
MTTQKDYICPVTDMEFVFVKGGCYHMGDVFGEGEVEERPVHKVCLDDFYIGKYPVTQKEWVKVMENNPSLTHGLNYPVEEVSWYDVRDFISRLNAQTQKKHRLPTEAEWEYACRSGGKDENWAGTNDEENLGEYAWHDGNSEMMPHPVGQKKPNGLGIYDMSGNVWEWIEDVYDENAYSKHSVNRPICIRGSCNRVMRGGSWRTFPKFARSSYRSLNAPDFKDFHIGFRLVLEDNLLDFLLINV